MALFCIWSMPAVRSVHYIIRCVGCTMSVCCVYYIPVLGVLRVLHTHAAACCQTAVYRAFSKRRTFTLQKATF